MSAMRSSKEDRPFVAASAALVEAILLGIFGHAACNDFHRGSRIVITF